MKVLVYSLMAVMALNGAYAFSSAAWLAERNDDSDAKRLREAYVACEKQVRDKAVTPAQDVAFPIETYPNGIVKSRLRAKQAQMFLDTGFIWGEGVRVEQYKPDGKTVEAEILAENCLVDRQKKSGWVNGGAVLSYGKTIIRGHEVYFSFNREFIKIFRNSQIRSKDLKFDARSMKL